MSIIYLFVHDGCEIDIQRSFRPRAMFEFAMFAAPGNYCPARSAAAAGVACPVAFYCNGGSEDKQACPEGKLSLSY